MCRQPRTRASSADQGAGYRTKGQRRELLPDLFGNDGGERDVPDLELVPGSACERVPLEAEHLAVEPRGLLLVARRNSHEVDALGLDQPTEPSICNWMSRFISTAYSSGSSFVIGSTKPDTIMALASPSERPRLIR